MSEPRALAERQADLADMFALFNETTARLQESHDALQMEVRHLTAQLAQANAELLRKSRLAALGEMAAGIAHEIRNPLGGIQLYTSLLERDLEDPEPLALVRKIGIGVRNLNGIVGDVLAFARETTPQVGRCTLDRVIEQTLATLEPTAQQGGVDFDTRLQCADHAVEADARLLERALVNVVLNAIQASPAGGRVIVRTRDGGPQNDAICVDVIDAGCGLSATTIDKIFNPFFTDKDTGTGLGLAIVHRILECHGGSVSAQDNSGPGATFTLRIPRKCKGGAPAVQYPIDRGLASSDRRKP